MVEHYLQRDIIERLSQAESLRYSQLKPKELEANLFMYHLKQLIKDGYADKVDGGYRLSAKGLSYVGGLSGVDNRPRKQSVVYSIIALQNDAGEWLFGHRKLQPYIDRLTLVSGKQHFGESPEMHATRELMEKTGFTLPLQRIGFVDIRTRQNGEPLTHIVGHVYSGKVAGNATPAEIRQLTYAWYPELPPDAEVLPGTRELFKAITTSTEPFFLSLDIDE